VSSGFIRVLGAKQTKTDVCSKHPAVGMEEQYLRSTAGPSGCFISRITEVSGGVAWW